MKKIGLLMLLLAAASACNSGGTSFKASDIIENRHGEVSNEERLYQFYENTVSGEADAVRVTTFTTEGDPTYQDLYFDGNKIKSVEDSSEDKYGSGEVVERECSSILVLTSEKEMVYVLESCDPESEDPTILHLQE
ncbi:DUF4362 domain-containing protein [Planococcus sp. CPCC 101016]|uniref:DUF4362 domain-containing protein n=1 Tax=Planococcus sp. CPCC 101016 TaxID=2599617 RepID=UPI0016459CC7|nr:DUF4362 domain-containing protein [Planococcus sp. CPCC 101016]